MFSGRLFPNGEWGICRSRKMKPEVPSRGMDKETLRWNVERWKQHGYDEAALAAWNERRMEPGWDVDDAAASLGLSMLANSHSRAVRGEKGITRYGGKMVRNGAFLLQERYGKGRLSFLTLTLPPLTREHWAVLCESWGDVVRVFMQRLQRHLRKHRLPTYVISVTEIQELRHRRTGVPGLHLHMLFVGANVKCKWKLRPQEIRSWWREIVSHCLGCCEDTYTWGSVERLESIRKDAASYLGKYLSKGSLSISALRLTSPWVLLPHSWWNCSMKLRKWIKQSIIPLTGQVGKQLWVLPQCMLESLNQWYKEITLPSPMGESVIIAMAGKLRPEKMSQFLALVGCDGRT